MTSFKTKNLVLIKMTDSEYTSIHYWIRKQRGKPQKCEQCGTTENRRYHWANIPGDYKREINDWQRLCAPCHVRKDRRRDWRPDLDTHCVHGHELTESNTYNRKNGERECRICRATAMDKCSRESRIAYNNLRTICPICNNDMHQRNLKPHLLRKHGIFEPTTHQPKQKEVNNGN